MVGALAHSQTLGQVASSPPQWTLEKFLQVQGQRWASLLCVRKGVCLGQDQEAQRKDHRQDEGLLASIVESALV